ncbi:hypothetical protein L0Y49_04430 [bacterium]|nr:hypothetical protein [bacterium]
MFLFTTIAALSFILLVAMFAYRAWEIRAGRFSVKTIISGSRMEADSGTRLPLMHDYAASLFRRAAHGGKRAFIKGYEKAKAFFAAMYGKRKENLAPEKRGASFFLKHIAAHKEKNRLRIRKPKKISDDEEVF